MSSPEVVGSRDPRTGVECSEIGPWSDGVGVALRAWIVARVVVLAALGLSRYVVDHAGVLAASSHIHYGGLLAWDGSWYSAIASKGYAALPQEALRFFPTIPVAARVIGVSGIGARAGLVLISNALALVAGVLLYRLVRLEGKDRRLAERAVWLLALAPPAFVFVMGYTDSTAVALAIAVFYALRRRRWLWAAAFALVVGTCRPTGFLLAVPAAIEALRGLDVAPWRERVERAVAVVAAPAGTLVYLIWVGARFGDLLLPFRVQTAAHLRGKFADPFTTLYHATTGLFHEHVGTALHVPWFLLLVALTVVAWRRLPLAYGAFSAVVVASSVVSSNLDSLERYALFAFPLVIVAAELTRREQVERVVFVLSAVAMFAYATLAFLGLVGP